MPVNDPIGDMLTRMRNAQHARKADCVFSWSRIKEQMCELLKREGYISEIEIIGEKPHQNMIVTFVPGKDLMLKRISKPGQRTYSGKASALRPVLRGFGIAILTTSKGLMTDKEAREKNIGGEILCTIA